MIKSPRRNLIQISLIGRNCIKMTCIFFEYFLESKFQMRPHIQIKSMTNSFISQNEINYPFLFLTRICNFSPLFVFKKHIKWRCVTHIHKKYKSPFDLATATKRLLILYWWCETQKISFALCYSYICVVHI